MPTTTTAPKLILPLAPPTLGADGTVIDLVFDTAMAAGSGTITITDGAVQTVIDRATGQPATRVVGATDTHTVSAASVIVDGTHVKLNVAGLLPGHQYSILMGSGVLVSSAHVAFGGIRSTSQLEFTAPDSVDHEGPSFVSASLDAGLLKLGGSLQVTLTFSEIVSGLNTDALTVPNAAVSSLTPSGDGHVWVATLVPSGAFEQAGNALTIDMSKVHDSAGNAGACAGSVATYAVDTRAPTGVSVAFDGTVLKAGGSVGVTFTFSEAVKDFTASAITAPHAAIGNLVSTDGGHTWTATLTALDPNTSSGNQLSVDMSQLQDLNGNAGSGSFVSSGSYAIDTAGPEAPAIALDGGLVSANDSVGVVITFKEKVSLDADALIAPNAGIQDLHSLDGGMTWLATLRPGTPVEASANTLSVDMSKVHDAAGNAGSGSAPSSANYAVDSKGPTASITLDGSDLRYGERIVATVTLSDDVEADDLIAALRTPNARVDDWYRTEDGKGLIWKLVLVPDGSGVSASNVLSLDLSKLSDEYGNMGSGSVDSPMYAADNAVHVYVEPGISFEDTGSGSGDYVTNAADQRFGFALSGSPGSGQHIEISIDGQVVSNDGLVGDGSSYWYHDSSATHFADGVHSFSARVVDDAGHGSAAITQEFTIDTVGPTLEHWPEGAITIGAPDALELRFTEALDLSGEAIRSIVFTDDGGGATVTVPLYASFLSEDGKTLTIRADQHHLQAGRTYHFTLPAGLSDLAGNAAAGTPLSLHVASDDLLPPSATSAIVQQSKGIYGIGTQIEIAVAFDEAVKVAGSGQPVLNLSNGGVAVFHALSADKQTMYFTYTVGADHEADSGNLQLNGSAGLVDHVSDLAGNMLDLAHIDFSSLGNLSPSGYGGPIQIDAHASPAPGAPALAIGSDTGTIGDGLTGDATPTLSGVAAEGGGRIELYLNGSTTALTSADVGAGGAWSLTVPDNLALADGVYNLTVRQVDAAGNRGASSDPLVITVDQSAPAIPARAVLDAASDSGISSSDGITNIKTPKLTGTALEAGGTIEIYDGATLIGTAEVQGDKSWSYTVGTQPARLAQFADGTHQLTVKQVDAAGNRSAASDILSVTVDTVAPSVTKVETDWKNLANWLKLEFNEKIVFANNGTLDVLDATNLPRTHHAWNVKTNWEIDNNDAGVPSVLELNLGLLSGLFHLVTGSMAIQDVAGNAAIIGTPTFTIL